MTSIDPVVRFWSKVTIGNPQECWPWNAGKDKDGYGKVWFNGRNRGAHVMAYRFTKGQPNGWVLHLCDNPECCNPKHLRDGTPSENMRDMIKKGRQNRKGDNGHCRKLSSDQVISIRKRYAWRKCTMRMLGNEYGVTVSAIHHAIYGKNWGHL